MGLCEHGQHLDKLFSPFLSEWSEKPFLARLHLRVDLSEQGLRLCGPLIGGAIMATWLRVLEQTHSNHLGRYLTAGDVDAEQILAVPTERFQSAGAAFASQRALAGLSSKVQIQANALAYIDWFWLTFGPSSASSP